MFRRQVFRYIPFVLTILSGFAVPAQAQRPATWVVPDVVGQFNALTERADPMGFHIGESRIRAPASTTRGWRASTVLTARRI